jgi:hypothetical protein
MSTLSKLLKAIFCASIEKHIERKKSCPSFLDMVCGQDDWAEWGWYGTGHPLEPYPGTNPCVRCGYCCKKSACPFGTWDVKKGQCSMLIEEDGKFGCSRYEEIINLPPSQWVKSPAFGCGCSSSKGRGVK